MKKFLEVKHKRDPATDNRAPAKRGALTDSAERFASKRFLSDDVEENVSD